MRIVNKEYVLSLSIPLFTVRFSYRDIVDVG